MIFLLIGVLLVSSLVDCADVRVDPLVLINQGLVRGRRASDGEYSTFLGVPYAQVDVDNPFGTAESSPKFKEIIFNAYDGSVMCPQTTNTHSDLETLDCLKLNMYVPTHSTTSDPMPVLLYLHGGNFSQGNAGEYGVKNLVRHGIIVVMVNYRLGPYGFMCLDVQSLPGNQGLRDQYLAMQWIRQNINAFGGNPYNVTLAGQGAGAASALLHLYADNLKLFHKIIIESSTAQTEGMFVDADVNAAIKIAEYLGLNTTNSLEALDFLAQIPHTSVTSAAKDLNLELKPCKERSFSGVKNFVETDPYSLSNENKVRNTPVLIGHTNKEQISLDSNNYYVSDPFYKKIQNNFNLNPDQLTAIGQYVKHFYLGDKAITRQLASQLEDFESDFVYNHPLQRTIGNLLSENADPIYEYVFNYVGDTGAEGAGHSAELNYLFEMYDNKQKRTEKDQLIVDRITTLWANFVKYGNPTPSGTTIVPVTWTAVSATTRPYLVIDSNVTMESRVFNDRMAFWDLFYTNYGAYNKLKRLCSLY